MLVDRTAAALALLGADKGSCSFATLVERVELAAQLAHTRPPSPTVPEAQTGAAAGRALRATGSAHLILN